MFKIAVLIWIVLGTVFAGVGLTLLLTVPQFSHDPMRMIPIVVIATAILAIPFSFMIAKRIQAMTAGR